MLIRGARQVLTLHAHSGPGRATGLERLGVIVDGSILIRNDRIEAVGPARRIENMTGARNAQEIDAARRVVMPAFIDAHGYPVPQIRTDGSDNIEHRRAAASRSVHALPAKRLQSQMDERARIMVRHGTATIGALSGYGLDCAGDLKILRVLAAQNGRPLDIVSILNIMVGPGDDPDTLGRCELAFAGVRRKLAAIACVRCVEDGGSLGAATSFLGRARAYGLGIRVDLQPGHDPALVDMALDMSALAITISGALRPGEVEHISASPTLPVLLPESCPGLGRELIDGGAAVALGTGINPETGGTASMVSVLEFAMQHLGMSFSEALWGATVNAAIALGEGAVTGSIEHGKRADLIILNASDYREIPLLPGTNPTHSMVKRGVLLFEEEFTGWPEER